MNDQRIAKYLYIREYKPLSPIFTVMVDYIGKYENIVEQKCKKIRDSS